MPAYAALARRASARAFVWISAAGVVVACSQTGAPERAGAAGSGPTGGASGAANDTAGNETSAGRETGSSAGRGGAAAGAGGRSLAGHGGAVAGAGGASGAGRGGSASGVSGSAASGVSSGGGAARGCDAASLVWRSANKTNYTSYPDPGSEECVKYNGCMWAGQFAACDAKETETWVSEHDIVAAFPDFDALKLHDLCLRQGTKTIVVTVLDTCGDSDCDGCCTENRGSADELIDVESYTDARWGVPDGPIEWADLGPTTTNGCQ